MRWVERGAILLLTVLICAGFVHGTSVSRTGIHFVDNEKPKDTFSCEKNENCENNGTCVENVCDCKEGSSGDYCEIVAGCDQLNCSAGISDCALDEKAKEGVCICKKKSDIYLNDTCVACEKNENCENNGTCVENVCDCKEGSSGDYCEIVAGCDQLNCSAGISDCALDEKAKEGVCICKKKSDIYLNDTCVACEKNENCENNGTCVENVCDCKEGSSGDYCEIVAGCDELNCSAGISDCALDEKAKEGVCICKKKSDIYLNDTCVACEKNENCENNGTCVENVCDCKEGSSGDYCEIVAGCDQLNCSAGVSDCALDEKTKEGVCICKKKSDIYLNDTCVACEKNENCENNGTCVENVCDCKEGSSGDYCEIVAGCDQLNCSAGVSDCALDEKTKEGVCICKKKSDIYLNDTCVACEKNENCENNGTCVENVCDCKEGSSGDYCEIVAGCDQLNCSAGVSDCALDEKTKEGVCICKKKSDIYLNDTCVACEKNENCENNGTCVENVCDCKEGSSGDYCEIVAGCDQLNCSAGVSDCALDEKTKEGVCICKKKSDIYLNDTCVACEENENCKNNGTCVENVCDCKEGSSGDYCEIVAGCDQLNCVAEVSDCVLDENSKGGVCICKKTSDIYLNDKCVACEKNENCENNGTCVENVCDCKEGSSGDYCEIVAGCDQLNCSAGVSDCALDEKTKEGVCICKKKSDIYLNDTCVACEKNENCENNGTCVENVCDCKEGSSGDYCEIVAGCDQLNCSAGVSDCALDEKTKEGVCICKKKERHLFERHVSCEKNENCENNGTCVENVCDCKEGSSGDYCEIVAGCDQLNCSAGVSDCALDEKTKEGVCICKKKSDIYLNDTCVACEKMRTVKITGLVLRMSAIAKKVQVETIVR
ncbi:tenascin-X [Trichonephila clavipes]|nr:tenascin-X [Trichonephila clavipes]